VGWGGVGWGGVGWGYGDPNCRSHSPYNCRVGPARPLALAFLYPISRPTGMPYYSKGDPIQSHAPMLLSTNAKSQPLRRATCPTQPRPRKSPEAAI
jgi:hypothetical protein